MGLSHIGRWPAALVLILATGAALAQDSPLAEALRTTGDGAREGARAQAQIDTLAEHSSELLAEYRARSQELDRLESYNRHLEALVADQDSKLGQMDTDIESALIVQQEIIPLMGSMIDNLDAFVRADLPIRTAARAARVQRLRDLMGDAGVTTAEKYRQIMDAYKIEMDIGRTIESYAGEVTRDGRVQAVNFLAVGRIVLAYQSEDRSVTAFWNKHANPPGWQDLPGAYRQAVDNAMRIASQQSAPNLLVLPVSAPGGGR